MNTKNYVDLGLPSGTLWAICNLDATKPSDFGKFYQWGDIKGYSDIDVHQFNWQDYKWRAYDNLTNDFGYTLLGKPVYESDNMDNIGSGKTAIYYGDMSGLATKFVEELEIEVLREKYADQHAVGVVAWMEFDAKVEDAQKISKLVCKTGSN